MPPMCGRGRCCPRCFNRSGPARPHRDAGVPVVPPQVEGRDRRTTRPSAARDAARRIRRLAARGEVTDAGGGATAISQDRAHVQYQCVRAAAMASTRAARSQSENFGPLVALAPCLPPARVVTPDVLAHAHCVVIRLWRMRRHRPLRFGGVHGVDEPEFAATIAMVVIDLRLP
jgi:hypothetical protein